jgi:hypothetical protein
METQQIRGYIDPRTGEYVRTTEDSNPTKVAEDIGFIRAWGFYWDGPLNLDRAPVFDRRTWINSPMRKEWVDSLTEEQQAMLSGTQPPEEVLVLEDSF